MQLEDDLSVAFLFLVSLGPKLQMEEKQVGQSVFCVAEAKGAVRRISSRRLLASCLMRGRKKALWSVRKYCVKDSELNGRRKVRLRS